MLLKQETQQTFVNGLLGLILSHLLSAGNMCVLLCEIMSCPSMGNSISSLSWVPSSCFCMVISLSLRVENNPFSGVCQSGGCIIHAGGAGSFTHWPDRLLMCNRRRPAATSSRRASFSALHQLLTRRGILHRAQQHHAGYLHVSNCRVRQLQFSGIFALRWAL